MKFKLHKPKSSIVGRLQKQLTATSLNELSIYHRANVWVNKCQTLLTHPEETEQHRYSTGALSLSPPVELCPIFTGTSSTVSSANSKTSGCLASWMFLTVFTSHSVALARHHFTLGRKPTISLCVHEHRVRAGMTQQRGPANQSSAWKRLKLPAAADFYRLSVGSIVSAPSFRLQSHLLQC